MFELSKIFWAVAQPAVLLLIALSLGVLFLWSGWRRLGTWLLSLATLVLLAVTLFPLERLYLTPLERRFPIPELPAAVDGIIVLGGAISFRDLDGQPRAEINESGGDRLAAFAALARRYPEAKLVFSGGSGSLRHPELREADAAGALLADFGVDPARLILQRRSRNTWEDALYAKEQVEPQPGETWVLVTSAFHMPRAIGCFRQLGWEVIPYPVDFLAGERSWLGFEVNPVYSLGLLTIGTKEWVGLAAYRLMDRTPALIPAP
jgi:uncharacterized SAM-binding protein YcdF (DUF218 family)